MLVQPMTEEIRAIMLAYEKFVDHGMKMRDEYLKDLSENPTAYEGIDVEDAYIWFIESF